MRYAMRSGFTLAELLIALAILGVLATFAIPKLLQAQADQKKAAVFKETLATLNAVVYDGIQTGAIRDNMTQPQLEAYMKSKVNHVKQCLNSSTEGCWTWDASSMLYAVGTYGDGMVLHNGATVAYDVTSDFGIDNCYLFEVDWNGAAGPNLIGQDQIDVSITIYDSPGAGSVPAGRMEPQDAWAPGSVALYNNIFK